MSEQKEWYTSAEAAEYLGVKDARLARLRREGRIKGIVGGGKNPRYTMYHINDLKTVDVRDLRKKKDEEPDRGQQEHR